MIVYICVTFKLYEILEYNVGHGKNQKIISSEE